MNYTNQIKDVKAAIAQFQMETQSNSVIDFGIWYENLCHLAEREDKKRKR